MKTHFTASKVQTAAMNSNKIHAIGNVLFSRSEEFLYSSPVIPGFRTRSIPLSCNLFSVVRSDLHCVIKEDLFRY